MNKNTKSMPNIEKNTVQSQKIFGISMTVNIILHTEHNQKTVPKYMIIVFCHLYKNNPT